MSRTTQSGLRRAMAALATGALAASPLLFVAPAHAADSVTVTKADIAPTATPYEGWHQGAGAQALYDVTADGLSLIGRSQVINGYANNTNTLDVKNAVLPKVLPDVEYTVTGGEVFFQVPVFFTAAGATGTQFATLRPAQAADQGENDIELTDQWRSSRAIGTAIAANEAYPLQDILAAFDDYKTLAYGVYVDPGKSGSVSDITWAGTTTEFAPAPAASTLVTPAQVRPDESTYAGWHQGYANAANRHAVTANGLELNGSSQIINGYANNSLDVAAKNAVLPFALRNASFTVTEGEVTFQVPVFFDNGNGVQFATLRSNFEGVGTHDIKLTDQWQVSRQIGTIAKDTDVPLGDLLAAIGPNYKVLAFGVLRFGDGTSTVSDITWEGTKYAFGPEPAPIITDVTVNENGIGLDDTTYAGWHQGARNNPGNVPGTHQVTSANGLELTGRSQVINGYSNNTKELDVKNTDLRTALPGAAYTVGSGAVHFQVPIFFKDATATDGIGFSTLRPATPAQIGANTISLDDQWTTSRKIGPIPAQTSARLGDILAELKDYKVLAYGVYSEGAEPASVKDITWNGVRTSFVNRAPVASDVTGTATVGTEATVQLSATDPDGNPLTYSTTAEGAAVEGDQLTVTVPNDSLADVNVAYSVSDGRGGSDDAQATISVTKAASAVAVDPTSTTAGEDVTLAVTATSVTGSVVGGDVTVSEGSTEIATGTIGDAGKASLDVGTLDAGDHELTVAFAGTATTSPSESTVTVSSDQAMSSVTDLVVTPSSLTVATDPTVAGTIDSGSVSADDGVVTIKDGDTVVADDVVVTAGEFSTPIAKLAAGTRTLTVSYTGGANVADATATVAVEVAKAAPVVVASVSPASGYTTLTDGTVKVAVAAPSGAVVDGGTVTVKRGAEVVGRAPVTVADGSATVDLIRLPAGERVLTVTYSGSDSVNAATTYLRATVAKVPSKLTLTVPTNPKAGTKVTATVKVTSTAPVTGGLVDFYANGKKIGTAKIASNGTAKLSLGTAKKGTTRVYTRFRGTSLTPAAGMTRYFPAK